MYDYVIIAEKPSQARDYANALGIKESKDGYILLKDNIISNAVVTWGFGHLVQLKLPKDYSNPINNWDITNLPYKPEPLEYKVAPDKQKQFKIIKSLIKEAKCLVNACDIDREGSNIFYSILKLSGNKNTNVKRLWINSLVETEIIKGFKALRDNDKDTLMYREANARQVSDYLIGMNLSPLYTNLFKRFGVSDEVFSIGRVQTPTLFMIYQRYLDIMNFKEETFYEIIGNFEAESGLYNGKAKVKTTSKEEINSIYNDNQLSNAITGIVTNLETTEKQQQSPKLHSLSTLQSVINKRYRFSPEKTKGIVQSLYEKKILSYPRTDSNLITNEEFNYLKSNLEQLMTVYGKQFEVHTTESRKRYVNSSAVKEHHAIIPTSKIPTTETIKKLDKDEQLVLEEVVNTTLAMFAQNYIYDETNVITTVNNVEFFTKGKIEKIKGWKSLFLNTSDDTENNKDKDTKLPVLAEQEQVKAQIKLTKGKTTAPKPYTEGQLINLMKTCNKFVENDDEASLLNDIQGLGTEATRDGIIKTLKDKCYITVKKNTVEMTDKGIILCKGVEGTLLSSPEMTAKWELRLKEIGEGVADPNSFINNTMKFIENELATMKEKESKLNINNELLRISNEKVICDCINCSDGNIIDTNKIYKCNKCNQIFYKKYFNNPIPKKELMKLIQTGSTENKIKLKKKDGGTYTAYLKLKDDKEKGIKIYMTEFNK